MEVKCELCMDASDDAEAFCRHCAMFICTHCVLIHTKVKTYTTHKVIALCDLVDNATKSIPEKQPTTEKCDIHDESLTIFCYNCNCFVCNLCTANDHKEHHLELTEKATANTKSEILTNLGTLKESYVDLTRSITKIRVTEQEVETQKLTIINNIYTSFKELRDILNEREKNVVEEAVLLKKVG